MSEESSHHPFERTLGPGPYRFVGTFSINIEAGQQGRPYVDPSAVHPRFVTGCGTCAHCGHAILNICQIQVGNGDVYGVGTDCVYNVHLPAKEMSAIEKAERERQRKLRAERKERKHQAALTEAKELLMKNAAFLETRPDPHGRQFSSFLRWANWCVARTKNAIYLLAAIKRELTNAD